jgi:hypothetical protein
MQIDWEEAISQAYIDSSEGHWLGCLVVFIFFHFITPFMVLMPASIPSITPKSIPAWGIGQMSKH